jgi:FkbM family methyltransferase
MNKLFYKIWHNSPADIVSIIKKRLRGEFYLPEDIIDHKEFSRLAGLPRYLEGETTFMGKKLHFIDASTCGAMCHDIFVNQSYKFVADKDDPLIIDCGSNIGLSVIFFKLLYPKSRVIAFEPDPRAFVALRKNINSFGLTGVECHNQAIWISDGEINFLVEGGESGKIIESASEEKNIKVASVRLRKFLETKVDFLKIDIEGAEAEVIKDCADNLKNIDKLFVEYHSAVDQEQVLSEILQAITNAEMRYYLKEATSTTKNPFIEKISLAGFDLQLNITAWRFK